MMSEYSIFFKLFLKEHIGKTLIRTRDWHCSLLSHASSQNQYIFIFKTFANTLVIYRPKQE